MTSFFSWLESAWRELAYENRGPMKMARPLLLPLSWLYGEVARARRLSYALKFRKGQSAPLPVFSVGNLTVGGVGKTPFTLYLAHRLHQLGYRPAILLRGYGRKSQHPLVILPGKLNKTQIMEYGDESALLSMQSDFPVGISSDRMRGIQRLLEECDCDFVLLDDGFQHLRLQRDLDLVMLDGANLLGNGRVLPCGPLREPRAALRQANALIINGKHTPETAAFLKNDASSIFYGGLEWISIDPLPGWMKQEAGTAIPVAHFQREPVMLVSGIGSPERFKKQARSYGLAVAGHLAFPDHHWYTEEDIRILALHSRRHPLLLTEKDAIRFFALKNLPGELSARTFVVHAIWRMSHPDRFDGWLHQQVRRIVMGNHDQDIESTPKS